MGKEPTGRVAAGLVQGGTRSMRQNPIRLASLSIFNGMVVIPSLMLFA